MGLIIGYGNWMRTDDALGVWLAESPRPGWSAIATQQLMPEHAEAISRAARVVFLDAAFGATTDGVPNQALGTVQGELLAPASAGEGAHALGAFTHSATPALLLGAARDLYGNAPPALLVSVTSADFGLGYGFSPQIEANLQRISSEVDALIADFGRAGDGCAPVQRLPGKESGRESGKESGNG